MLFKDDSTDNESFISQNLKTVKILISQIKYIREILQETDCMKKCIDCSQTR